MTSLDEPRPNYHGVMAIDQVTGRYRPQFPRWKTNVRVSTNITQPFEMCSAESNVVSSIQGYRISFRNRSEGLNLKL